MAVLIKDPDATVRIMCAAMEHVWRVADEWDDWSWVRISMHGASLAMIGLGLDEQQADFEFLRDLAATRGEMHKEAKYLEEAGNGMATD